MLIRDIIFNDTKLRKKFNELSDEGYSNTKIFSEMEKELQKLDLKYPSHVRIDNTLKEMEKMDRVDLRIKMEAFKRGDFGPLYTVTLIKKLLMTYLLPMPIKLKLAKMFKFA